MSIASAAHPKHHLSQIQAGQETLASKKGQTANVGGLEDFLNELNQATNLRLQAQEELATEGRLKSKKTPEPKDNKTDPELQIVQKPDVDPQNPANIADVHAQSNPEIAKIMAALEQLNQRNQTKSTSLLSNWGEAGLGRKSNADQPIDLEMLRANFKNLGLENMLGDLEKAKASGNPEQIASMEAKLAQALLAQLANLKAQTNEAQADSLSAKATIDAKTLQALELQRNQIAANQTINQALQKQLLAQQQINGSVGLDTLRVLSVEPSLAQELKMKQAADLDTQFTLAQGALLGTKVGNALVAEEGVVTLEHREALVGDSLLLTKPLFDSQTLLKTEQSFGETIDSDFSGNLLSASQVAQSSATVSSTPTQIAMSLQEASVTSGPLHSEILNAARSGGGRIQLELTPPEQGTIRIDLRIDQSGRAYLIVEGANDAAKARLDQGGQQLKNEFAQMGLQLSLDLRQGDSRFAQNQQFGSEQSRFAQPSSSTDRSSMGIGLLSESLATTRFLSDNASGVSGIHLYA
jgi:hypothetical protein